MNFISGCIRIACLLGLTFSSPTHAGSIDVGGLIDSVEDDYNETIEKTKRVRKKNADDAKRKAAESARNRDKTNDFCYAIDNQDAQNACLGLPYAVEDERARNILLGNCYAFKTNSKLSQHLQYICTEGKRGCSLLKDATASYQCGQCGGTRQWIATYSLGVTINCYR
jgi:hypothetical protein